MKLRFGGCTGASRDLAVERHSAKKGWGMRIFKAVGVVLALASIMTVTATPALAASKQYNYDGTGGKAAERLVSRVSGAMLAGTDEIYVTFTPATASLPEAAAYLIKAVDDKGGEIYVQDLSKSILGEILIILLPDLFEIAKKVFDQWLEAKGYGQGAGNYNLLIVTDRLDDNSPVCYVRLEFYKKNNPKWATEKAKGVIYSSGAEASSSPTAVASGSGCP